MTAKVETSQPDYERILAESYAELIDKVQLYDSDANIDLIYRSYLYAKRVHSGQKRKSGEPYVIHPVAVASMLAELELDPETIAAGLLHDTIEDTLATHEDISELFGLNVADMVEGLSKISKMKFSSREEHAAENFRKMIFAMTQDIRIILVKLCDRSHNMRTLQHMPAAKQRRIAQETLDIYAPVANRLGIASLKMELENLSFRYLRPDLYEEMRVQLAENEEERQAYIDRVKVVLLELMGSNHVNCFEVYGRLKHDYSIYKKMVSKNLSLDQIHDKVAFRILVEGVGDCYQALGIVHQKFRPISERFKDFIAVPKSNGYRSLHTTVIGPEGTRIEIQIRTKEMHEIAEFGIAAHWHYKEGAPGFKAEQFDRLNQMRRLYESARDLADPNEFMESIKGELFSDEVYVFSPKGKVLEFPEGATPLDFAYTIHTEVGNRCVGARVDGRQVNLRYQLQSGQTVEIQTSANQKPNSDWLKIVVTSRAKNKIRAFLRQEERERGKELGREILEKEFRNNGLNFNKLSKAGALDGLIGDRKRYKNMDDVYYSVSFGKLTVQQVLAEVLPEVELEAKKPAARRPFGVIDRVKKRMTRRNTSPVRIKGESDIVVSFAKCCNPLYGDPITATITLGRGITVHQSDCPNVMQIVPERQLEVEWEPGTKSLRPVTIRVICQNKQGLLATLTKIVSQQEVNINSADARGSIEGSAVVNFEVQVPDRHTLNTVIIALERVRGVISVHRVKNY